MLSNSQSFNLQGEKIITKPLQVYAIEELSKQDAQLGEIVVDKVIEKNELTTSYLVNFKHKPNPSSMDTKNTTGQINIPNSDEKYPIILMIRGYVDQNMYTTGMGTYNAGKYFSENKYITISPDFLGYGGSDINSSNILESRFQTYTTALSLLSTIQTGNLPDEIKSKWDGKNIYIWAHSNGGQIVLTILTATAGNYPTTLWAPVSKPFPYSVLYYTDESADNGKGIRKALAEFELVYDVENFSFDNYLSNINAPIQIHQGTNDDAIPLSWSNNIVKKLKSLDKKIDYFVYQETDHNMRPEWNTVVERDVEFFKNNLD